MNLKAKFTKTETNNARYEYDKKERIDSFTAVVTKGGEISTPVSVKCYMGRSSSASVVYCNIWIHGSKAGGKSVSLSGSGSAGGWGYHKVSAAVDEALRSAGVQLYGSLYSRNEKPDMKKTASISGVGDSAIEAALVAICRALGYRGKVRIVRG